MFRSLIITISLFKNEQMNYREFKFASTQNNFKIYNFHKMIYTLVDDLLRAYRTTYKTLIGMTHLN